MPATAASHSYSYSSCCALFIFRFAVQRFLINMFKFIKNYFTPPIKHFSQEEVDRHGHGFHYKDKTYVHHSKLHPHETALFRLSRPQTVIILGIVGMLLSALIINWHTTLIVLIAWLTVVYFADLLFNLFLVIRSFRESPEINVTPEELQNLDERSLPKYTILCPLYKEWQVLGQFVTAMSALDYPKDKLQVLLLLEEDDQETISRASELAMPSYFEVIVVPHSLPKTKPKASNYGLKHATGDMIVIYDAEDIPDVLQLKKAVIALGKSDSKVKCIQAKLNFYNPHQNLLTRIFTAEYSLWFDLVLTGLQSIHAPIPLGGTSNHFRKQDLLDLKGWDSFNVTEDCDLGMRIAKGGYRTAIINSTTLEEANSNYINWFWQRTRWIKGYIQTYLVHMRRPDHFVSHWRDPHVITFQLVVGGKVSSMLINPIMWTLTICYFAFRAQIGTQIESFFPTPILYMGVFSMIIGNFLYLYYYMIGCAKREQYELIKYVFLVPLYWLAMSAAAYVSWYKFLVAPHYWAKTKHGLHLDKDTPLIMAPHPAPVLRPTPPHVTDRPPAYLYLEKEDGNSTPLELDNNRFN